MPDQGDASALILKSTLQCIGVLHSNVLRALTLENLSSSNLGSFCDDYARKNLGATFVV
jgi:hypothetical protein